MPCVAGKQTDANGSFVLNPAEGQPGHNTEVAVDAALPCEEKKVEEPETTQFGPGGGVIFDPTKPEGEQRIEVAGIPDVSDPGLAQQRNELAQVIMTSAFAAGEPVTPQEAFRLAAVSLGILEDTQAPGGGPTLVPVTVGGQTFNVSPNTAASLAQRNFEFNTLSAGDRNRFLTDLLQMNQNGGQFAANLGFSQQELQSSIQQAELNRQQQTSERLGSEEFAGGQNALDRALQTSLGNAGFAENQLGRQFTGGESALDRALIASQFASSQGLNENRFGLDVAQAQFGQNRTVQQDALSAANQLASLISLTDPAAQAAFQEAGGGVISNAIASGADALSNNALLPAARTLRGLEAPINAQLPEFQTTPFNFQPEPNPALSAAPTTLGGLQGPAPTATAQPITSPSGNTVQQNADGSVTSTAADGTVTLLRPGGSPAMHQAAGQEALLGAATPGTAQPTAQQQAGQDALSAFANPPSLAHGGILSAGIAKVGDQASGQPTGVEEFVIDPTRDAQVISRTGQPDAFRALMQQSVAGLAGGGFVSGGLELGGSGAIQPPGPTSPGGGFGLQLPVQPAPPPTAFDRASQAVTTPPTMNVPSQFSTGADDPFINRIRGIRQGVDTAPPIPGGAFNVGFGNLAPSLQQRFFAALQARFGVPQQDLLAEQQRFALQGTGRQLALGR